MDLLKKVNFYYYLVDHRLRKESSKEAKKTLDLLKKIDVKCKVLIWQGKKPKSNIQSIARFNRYSLLIKECKKRNLNNIGAGDWIRTNDRLITNQELYQLSYASKSDEDDILIKK